MYHNLHYHSMRNVLGDIGNIQYLNKQQFLSTNANINVYKPNNNNDNSSNNNNNNNNNNNDNLLVVQNGLVKSLSTNALDINKNEITDETYDATNFKRECNKELNCVTHIIDIDYLDRNDPLFTPDYAKDILSYMFKLEKNNRISSEFLNNKTEISKPRSKLVNSLIKVHSKLNLFQETLYMSVQIIDAYLDNNSAPEADLLLLSATSFFIASKYESRSLTLDTIVKMTSQTYSRNQIRKMEVNILNAIGFSLSKPLPLQFLRRFSRVGRANSKEHMLAKYLMELSLHDSEFSSFDPSYLAACSLGLSFKLFKGIDWDQTMEFYSTYNHKDLILGIKKLAQLVLKCSKPDYEYREAVVKYQDLKCLKISAIPELSGELINELASN